MEETFKEALSQAIDDTDPSVKEFADAVKEMLSDKYGDHNFGIFVQILNT